MFLPRATLEKKLLNLLDEDVGQGDLTTSLVVPMKLSVKAEVRSKESGIIAGMEEGKILSESLGLKVQCVVPDGEQVEGGRLLMKMGGDARTILTIERTLLNLISRMSGIATATYNLVKKIKAAKLGTKIACTRKVAPGLLYFDKKAVILGGGDSHRLHLDDMVLIKDNHISVAGSIAEAVKRVKEEVSFCKKIEVEVTCVRDVISAVKAGVDVVMLDNFSIQDVKEAVRLLKEKNLYGNVLLEASGGITRTNVIDYASVGVDIVSLGQITQSSKSLDLNLEIVN
jgi:nicotinate-nucleotide pyrophosphorylase (carboxylating)